MKMKSWCGQIYIKYSYKVGLLILVQDSSRSLHLRQMGTKTSLLSQGIAMPLQEHHIKHLTLYSEST